MRNQIKLYSFSLPLAIVPALAFSFDQIIPYLKGMEFRTFMASVISEIVSGAVNAFIASSIAQFLGA